MLLATELIQRESMCTRYKIKIVYACIRARLEGEEYLQGVFEIFTLSFSLEDIFTFSFITLGTL